MQTSPPAERSSARRKRPASRRTRERAASWIRRALPLAASLALATAAHAVAWTVQVRDDSGRPLADAAIAVEVNGQPSQAPPQTMAQMAQRQRQFQPYVLVIQTGTAVSFPNFDTVRHHVYSFSATKTFDIKLYTGTPARPEVFDKPGVATLGCNIHDRMSAHIVVVDTPRFAKSDSAGTVHMDLPPGQHRLLYWHPLLDGPTLRSQPLRVGSDGGTTELALQLKAD